jgi:hypothetical protein
MQRMIKFCASDDMLCKMAGPAEVIPYLTFSSISPIDAASYGTLPTRHSYARTPIAQQSTAGP